MNNASKFFVITFCISLGGFISAAADDDNGSGSDSDSETAEKHVCKYLKDRMPGGDDDQYIPVVSNKFKKVRQLRLAMQTLQDQSNQQAAIIRERANYQSPEEVRLRRRCASAEGLSQGLITGIFIGGIGIIGGLWLLRDIASTQHVVKS